MDKKRDILEHIQMKPRTGPGQLYFETLAQTVLDKAGKQEAVIVPLFKRPFAWIGGAAAAVLVVLGIGLFNAAHNTVGFDSVTPVEAAAYVEDNIDAFDEDLLAEFLFDQAQAPVQETTLEEFEDLTVALPAEKAELFSGVADEDVLEYLETQADPQDITYY